MFLKVHRSDELVWEGGPESPLASSEGVLVNAGLQPCQTLQHPLLQRAQPPHVTPRRRL